MVEKPLLKGHGSKSDVLPDTWSSCAIQNAQHAYPTVKSVNSHNAWAELRANISLCTCQEHSCLNLLPLSVSMTIEISCILSYTHRMQICTLPFIALLICILYDAVSPSRPRCARLVCAVCPARCAPLGWTCLYCHYQRHTAPHRSRAHKSI